MSEETFETPQPTPPVEQKSTDWTKIILATVVGLGLLLTSAYAGYWYGIESSKVKTQNQVTPTTTPTPTTAPTPTTPSTEDESRWKTYSDGGVSFSYPSTWEVLDDVPEYYRAVAFDFNDENWVDDYLKSKMFAPTCNGPILRNTKVKTTIIAVDAAVGPDGGWCFSLGDFTNSYDRTTTILDETRTIKVSRWTMGEYVYPVTEDNSGTRYTPKWKGDLFQSYFYDQGGLAAIALVYQDGQDDTAESVFDQILSTFQFLD